MSVALGSKYRDTLTGVEGTATARTEFLYGCVRVALEWGKDGEMKCDWFDEQRLVTVFGGKQVETSATTGGPQSAPPSRDPSR